MNKFEKRIDKRFRQAVSLVEKFLALVILVALIIFIGKETLNANISDVNSVDFIQQLISDVLLMLLGLEVVRLLIVPSVQAALELLIFVVARKTLDPNITSKDLLFDVIAFAILLILYIIFIKNGILDGVKNIWKEKSKK